MSKDELNDKELDNVVGGLTTSPGGDLSSQQQLNLQSAVESGAQATQVLSNCMKAASDAQSGIASNLKA